MAEKNAQISLDMFERIVLKTDSTSENVIENYNHTNAETEITVEVDAEIVTPIIIPAVKDTIEQVAYTPIAKLSINKIDLNVTVLSEWRYDLLEISVNKFHGPAPNEIGNFIVIGHNYKNNAHFGNLDLLEVGDVMTLTDLSGRTITFVVFEILIIKPNEVERLNTDETMSLTLVTCDTDNTFRLVVKSKAIGSEN